MIPIPIPIHNPINPKSSVTAKTYERGIPKIQKQTDNMINGAHTSPVPLNAPSETAIKVSKINRNPTKNIIS